MALGITFQETMSGWFALGDTKPQAGASRGRANRTRLTLRACIVINNLDHFLTDETHTAELSGAIDFDSFGDNTKVRAGVFNLFVPAEGPQLKHMVYELSFEQAEPAALPCRQETRAGRRRVRRLD